MDDPDAVAGLQKMVLHSYIIKMYKLTVWWEIKARTPLTDSGWSHLTDPKWDFHVAARAITMRKSHRVIFPATCQLAGAFAICGDHPPPPLLIMFYKLIDCQQLLQKLHRGVSTSRYRAETTTLVLSK